MTRWSSRLHSQPGVGNQCTHMQATVCRQEPNCNPLAICVIDIPGRTLFHWMGKFGTLGMDLVFTSRRRWYDRTMRAVDALRYEDTLKLKIDGGSEAHFRPLRC